MEVRVAFEDLSSGIAEKHAQELLGLRLSGVWHSSLWVFGAWHSFAGSIGGQQPAESAEIVTYGYTERTEADFAGFLSDIKERFEAEYDLFFFNCHTFTQDCLQFLLRVHLPAHFFRLPHQFHALPLEYEVKEQLVEALSSAPHMVQRGELSHFHLFGTDLTEIRSAKELFLAGQADWTVVLYWRSDIDFEMQNRVRQLAREYRDRGVFWAVNAEAMKSLGPVLYHTCVEVLSRGTRLALISSLDTELVPVWLRPSLLHTQVLSSTAPIRFPALCRSAMLRATRAFPRTYSWLQSEKCLHMPNLLREAQGLAAETGLHVIAVIALEPAGAEAIAKDWEAVYSQVEKALNRGSSKEAALALRLLVNLYCSEPGISLCIEEMPVLHGLALHAFERNEAELHIPASALYFNLALTYPEPLERDEFMAAAQALQRVLRTAEKELEALYAAKALGMLAAGCEAMRSYLKESGCQVPLRSAIHIALESNLRAILENS